MKTQITQRYEEHRYSDPVAGQIRRGLPPQEQGAEGLDFSEMQDDGIEDKIQASILRSIRRNADADPAMSAE